MSESDSNAESVSLWLEQLKQGDQDAAQRLWERYFSELVALARQRMRGAQTRAADEEDVALDVFYSLCNGAVNGRFPHLDDRTDLWRLLLTLTRQKAVDHRRRESRQKRGGGQVRGESVFGDPKSLERAAGLHMIVGEDPTPSFLVQLDEHCRRLLASLRDDTMRRIALDRMEGFTIDEISERNHVSRRSVDRKLRMIQEQWARELEA